MKKVAILVAIILAISTLGFAQSYTFPESMGGGEPLQGRHDTGHPFFMSMTAQENIPWGMPPLREGPGWSGDIEIIKNFQYEEYGTAAACIQVSINPFYYSADGEPWFASTWFGDPKFFLWNTDCECYLRTFEIPGQSKIRFESFNYQGSWADGQTPGVSGKMIRGCLDMEVEQAPPWTIVYTESTSCIWTEFTLRTAPTASVYMKSQPAGRRGPQ